MENTHTHKYKLHIYIKHESNRELAERKRTIQVSEDTEKNNRGGELIKKQNVIILIYENVITMPITSYAS